MHGQGGKLCACACSKDRRGRPVSFTLTIPLRQGLSEPRAGYLGSSVPLLTPASLRAEVTSTDRFGPLVTRVLRSKELWCSGLCRKYSQPWSCLSSPLTVVRICDFLMGDDAQHFFHALIGCSCVFDDMFFFFF